MSKYPCQNEGCTMVFTNRMSRKRHKYMCDKEPADGTKESKSIIIREGQSKKWKCMTCSKTYKSAPSFSNHKHQCQNKLKQKPSTDVKVRKEGSFSCSTCSKQFDRQSKLKRHETVHEKAKIKCTLCQRCFKRQDHFEKHNCEIPSHVQAEDIISSQNEEHPLFYQLIENFVNTNQDNIESINYNCVPMSVPVSQSVNSFAENEENEVTDQEDNDTSQTDLETILHSINEYLVSNVDAETSSYNTLESCNTSLSDVELEQMDKDTDNFMSRPSSEEQPCSSDFTPTNGNTGIVDNNQDTPHRRGSGSTTSQRQVRKLHNELDDTFAKVTPKRLSHIMKTDETDENVRDIIKYTTQEKMFLMSLALTEIKYLRSIVNTERSYSLFARELIKLCGKSILEKQSSAFFKFIMNQCGVNHLYYYRVKASIRFWLDNEFQLKRNRLSNSVKQKIYNTWLAPECSIVTADRRNKRDRVLISKDEFLSRYGPGLKDESLEEAEKRRTPCLSAVRKSSVKTVKAVQKILADEGINVSTGTIVHFKPFYIGIPSLREQILCMCGFCLNSREIYNAL